MKLEMMKTTKLVLSLLAVVSIVGCGTENKTKEKNKETIRVSVNDRMSSDELTSSAEQLIGPYTFMLSHSLAKQAIEKDPTNVKAQFIYKLTKRFEAFRGIHTRMKGMMNAEQLAKHNAWLKEFPESPMKAFLSQPGKSITTVAEAQAVVSEYFNGVKEFRRFLIDNQDARIDLQINPHVFAEQIKQEMYDRCQIFDNGQEGWDVTCDYEGIAVKKMNSADLLMLRQMAAGEIIYGMLNSYSLDGIETLESLGEYATNKQKADHLFNNAKFGKLRQGHDLSLLKEFGSDLSAAAKWALKFQKELCPQGYEQVNQRKGFLFSDGICIESEVQESVQDSIKMLDRALVGITGVDLKNGEGELVNTKVDAFAWVKNPIRDLRSVRPFYNECDKVVSVQDETVGGIFVESNFNSLLDKKCE